MKKIWLIAMTAAMLASAGCQSGGAAKETAKSSAAESQPKTEAAQAAESTEEEKPEKDAKVTYPYQLTSETQFDYNYTDDTKTNLMAQSRYQLLQVNAFTDPDTGKAAEADPVIKTIVEGINQDTKKISESFFKDNEIDMREMVKDRGTDNFDRFEQDDSLNVIRADSKCLSVVRENYSYLGGAHGYSAQTAYNYDAQTGKRLAIGDVLTGTDKLADILAAELKKQNTMEDPDLDSEELPEKIRQMIAGDGYEGDNDLGYLNWYVDRTGVWFIFNQYDIASYAAGRFFVHLTPEDYPDLVKKDYLQAPESFIEKIEPDQKYTIAGNELTIHDDWSPDGSYKEKTTVTYAGKNVTFEPYDSRAEIYRIHTEDGDFLYFNHFCDNDYQLLTVMKLSADGAMKTEEQPIGVYGAVMIDPDNMLLSGRADMISTMDMTRMYHVGKDGKPVANTKYFALHPWEDFVLTLKQDIDLDTFKSPDDENAVNQTIRKGTKLRPVRTDNDSFTDCRLDDGTIVRLYVNVQDWPHKVNGKIDVEELLDGVIFAG